MAIDNKRVDFRSAPEDNAELFEIYYPYIVALVKKNGIDESNKEDVAAEIMASLVKRDFRLMFQADKTFRHDGVEHHARFKTFLSSSVKRYLMGHRDKQARRADREMLMLDRPTQYDDYDTTWSEWFGVTAQPSHEDAVIEHVDAVRLLRRVREHLGTIPKRNAFDKCNLVELFDAVMEQLLYDGAVSHRKLQEQFDMSTSGINSWMWWLKDNVTQFLGLPMPRKRTRKLK